MKEYVFRRKHDGRRSQYWSGRYSLGDNMPVIEVALRLKDEASARAKLREIVTEAQREAYNLIPKKSYRDGASAAIGALIDAYKADLTAQHRAAGHVKESIARIRKVVVACKWRRLRDVTPARFLVWRASFNRAAKTVKEYQVSLNAWLNWLVDTDRLERNPLQRVPMPETRGKSVRPSRALTIEELRALFATSGEHSLAYQMLVYTGQRYSEIAALRWGEIDLGNTPCLRLFAAQTKDLDDRAIPLHPALADKLRAAKPLGAQNDALVFKAYPTLEMFYTDLKRAGIDRIDAAGRRVHLHALRKTFQTMGVQAGINQRAAQEFLGHSDANTTAKIYTHTPALGLSSEIQKLPWWEPEKALSSATVTFNAQNELIIEKLNDLVNLLKSTDCKGLDVNSTAAAMAARHGFEP